MYTPIHESITVAGVFEAHGFVPKKFRWKNQVIPIDKITATYQIKEREGTQRQYSVVAAGALYRLIFFKDAEHWQLESIWCD